MKSAATLLRNGALAAIVLIGLALSAGAQEPEVSFELAAQHGSSPLLVTITDTGLPDPGGATATFTGASTVAGPFAGDASEVYESANSTASASCTSATTTCQTLTITFNKPVTGFSLEVLNGDTQNQAFTLTANDGEPAQNPTVNAGGGSTVAFTGLGGSLTEITVTAANTDFTFAIDDVKWTDPVPFKCAGVGVSVEEFQASQLDIVHMNQLQSRCAFLIQNGSGTGTCTCGSGDNALVSTVCESTAAVSDTFQVSYFDVATAAMASAAGYGGAGSSGGIGDGTVRIVNPTSEYGTLCAMIYVFDDNEQLQTCCGCPVTPDGMRTLSVINDLTFDFGVNKGNLTAGVIDVISSRLNFTPGSAPPGPLPPGTNGSNSGNIPAACDPSGKSSNDPFKRATAVLPTPALRAWITHDECEQPGNIQ